MPLSYRSGLVTKLREIARSSIARSSIGKSSHQRGVYDDQEVMHAITRHPDLAWQLIDKYFDVADDLWRENERLKAQLNQVTSTVSTVVINEINNKLAVLLERMPPVSTNLPEQTQIPVENRPEYRDLLADYGRLEDRLTRMSAERDKVLQEHHKLSSRFNELLNELAKSNHDSTKTYLSGEVRLDEIGAKFRTFYSQEITTFCTSFKNSLRDLDSNRYQDRMARREAGFIIQPMLYKVTLEAYYRMHLAKRLTNFITNSLSSVSNLPVDPEYPEFLGLFLDNLQYIASGKFAIKELQEEIGKSLPQPSPMKNEEEMGLPSKPLDSPDAKAESVKETDSQSSGSINNHEPDVDIEKTRTSDQETAADDAQSSAALQVSRQEPSTVPEQIIQLLYRELGVESSVYSTVSPTLTSELRNIIAKADELAQFITSTNPPGELWVPEANTVLDPEKHSVIDGPEEGVILYTAWPGYRVGKDVFETPMVLTKRVGS